ncbi:matrix-remodeling-associated protein 5 [Antennarius striatus]|uniref:matrix-remodeling-associated protein 5 n=1 Tax=Antennarius striatus TaxID=241820 RepID=UPI0035B0D2DD
MVACVLQALLVLVILPPAAPGPCPRPCSCPQPVELHCTFRSLFSVPPAVSKDVRRMNLGFNSINSITDQSLGGLRKLELLMIHGNDIHSLPDGAFRDLQSLQMLKLSYNKLREISRRALRGLWALARLHLDNNQLEFIHPDSFHGLTSLRLLQLEGNQLQQLHPATFATFTLMDFFQVSTLRHLYLSDNRLTSLPSRVVATMPQLENLYLHGNPWTCDCNMRWLQDWDKTSPGVLKCKKDRALPGGQSCPMCSSPRHLRMKELQEVENLVCSRPVIDSPRRTSQPDDVESEVMAVEDFREPLGTISLELSDEHGNEVDLECTIEEPRELTKMSWEQVSQLQLASNVTLSVDLECPVDREKYEQLWRLIAYYSSVPAHLKRGTLLREEPHRMYVYKQDAERDAQYYTGVKANVDARPAWLMQTSADLQLNRLQSSAKIVKLSLSTDLSEAVKVELVRRQTRSWAVIESTNTTRKAFSVILGSPSEMSCNVQSSGQPVIQWVLPDGSRLEAPYSSPDNRVSVSGEGRLVIKGVRHADSGIYYCIAKIHRDLTVLPFYLTVQESSNPPPGEDDSIKTVEGFSGGPISLPCVTSGSPEAEIDWLLPSSNIISFQANSSRALVYLNGTLHLPQAQLQDNGYYKCIAINQHGADTLATKVHLMRRKGVIRPLRKFPSRPQSASGVNTQIKVPTEEIEEASGDSEDTHTGASLNHLDPLRKRVPGGVATGRRVHPSRNMWRRPQVLRKPTGSQVEDKKNTVESRRRVNMSKTKIDPEKWADILAKIRDRNAQNTVTPEPVQSTTPRGVTEMVRQSQKNPKGSSDDGEEGQEHFTKPRIPTQDTQTKPNKHTKGSRVKNRLAGRTKGRKTSNIQQTPSGDPTAPTTPPAYSLQHTTPDTSWDLHTTSNGTFPPPQTTSAPRHAVTFWKASTNRASSASTIRPPENQTPYEDGDGAQTADWSEASERGGEMDETHAATSTNDRELSSTGSQIQPNPNESVTRREGNGNEDKEVSPSLPDPEDPTDGALESLATASPTTTTASTNARRRGSERKTNSKKKIWGRRWRPNRRKKKPLKPTPPTARTTVSPQLRIEPVQTTTVRFSTTVPFSGSQAASSFSPSHEELSASGRDATKVSAQPIPPPEASSGLPQPAKPLFKSTSAVPSFPTAAPGLDHGKTSSQTALRISGTASPAEWTGGFTSTTQQSFMALEFTDAPRVSATEDTGPVPHSDNPSGGFHTEVPLQTDGLNQLDHQYTPTASKDSGVNVTLSPSPSASLSEHEMSSMGSMTTQGVALNTQQISTTEHPVSEIVLVHSSSPDESTNSEEIADIEIDVDAPTEGMEIPAHTSTISSTPHALNPSVTTPSAAPSNTPSTAAATSSPWPTFPDSQSQEQQVQPITTSEPWRTSESYPEDQSTVQSLAPFISVTTTSPALEMNSRQTIKPTPAPVPTAAPSQTGSFRDGLLTSTQDSSRTQQLPGPRTAPPGKPRIIKKKFQTFIAKAGTDFQLPCVAEGEPMPFLSWSKVTKEASIAQFSLAQRFEIHPNGSLVIRNTQPTDGGQYLCTALNQYGTDKMLVNLEVLSHPPRILHPQQRNIAVPLGGNVDLECTVEGHPLPQTTWVLPNHAHMAAAPMDVAPLQRVSIWSNGTLRINRATYTDGGIYKCITSSAAGTDTASVHLQVSALPPVIRQTQSENYTLQEGSPASIHCSATGAPQPVIRWTTPDGAQLTASEFVTGHNLIVFPNGTLYIHRLGLGNGGRYECSASNVVASSRRTVILNVKRTSAKASITSSSPQRTDVTYGGRLLLNCVATGAPEPRIIWRTPSKKLVDSQYSFDSRIKVFSNGTITIHSVTDKDSGDYLCVARNKMGDDYVLLRVNVLTRPAKIKQKQQLSSQEVVYGGDLKVDCVASGLPNPEISWALPDGTMVNPVKQRDVSGGRSRRYVVFDNGTLYFNHVGMPEEGDYTCYAENQLGKDEMKVRVKVKVGTSAPQTQENDQKLVRVLQGEPVRLSCDANGKSDITWIAPTNRVISSSLDKYQILDDGTLVIQKVQHSDGGKYTCMARNHVGRELKVFKLEILVASPVINGFNGTTNAIKVTATQDQKTFVDCAAKGTPTPRVMWVLPGNVILPAPYYSNRMIVHQNGTLEIRSLKRTDSGRLVCIARNEGGEVRLVVHLDVKDVLERPQTTRPKTNNLSLSVGNTMTLNCTFEGSTQPHVTWVLPNGTPLHSGTRFSKFFHRLDGSLVISNPSIAEAGVYRCLGQTFQGFAERTITLSPGKKPEISNRYSTPVSIMNGGRLFLHCTTSGEPPRLTWTLPTGVVLNRPQRAGRYAILANGTLAIQQVSVYDRGLYTCRVANEYGGSAMSVSVIVIASPPRITSGPPSVTYAKRGVAIQLNCIATGIPKADVAWETPDKTRLAVSAQPRLFGNKYLHPQGSLIIQNPTQKDSGVYRCTARNAIGTDSKATFLNVF